MIVWHTVLWSVGFAVVFLAVLGLVLGPPVYGWILIKRKLDVSETRFLVLHSEKFWHGVRLGYAHGTVAGGVIGGMVLLFTDWRWSILLFGAGAIGVCASVWERLSWEHR